MPLKWSIRQVLSLSFFLQPSLSSLTLSDFSPVPTDKYPWPWKPQFRDWFPAFGTDLANISMNTCKDTLKFYDSFYNAPSGSRNASRLFSACYAQERCILENLPADDLATLSASSIFLGLIPGLLSQIGPSVAETSLLSTKRPFLSFLISLNAPAIYPTRLLEYNDPINALSAGTFSARDRWRPWDKLISLIQYILLLGGAVNVFYAVVDVGNKTVLSWSCTLNFAPTIWAVLPAIIHLIAASSYSTAKIIAERYSSQKLPNTPAPVSKGTSSGFSRQRSLWSRFVEALRWEFVICANQHSASNVRIEGKPHWIPVFLNVLTGILGFIHIAFGILVFSCLQFLSQLDALENVVLPFLASTAVARLILVFEMGGLRGLDEEQRTKKAFI